jgi:3-methyladenine DNA glycosylase AlkD
MNLLTSLRDQIRSLGSESSAQLARRYFKTGPGDYAEGDVFLGVSVPQLRGLLPRAAALSEAEIEELLREGCHEERLFALLLLVQRFQRVREGEALRGRLVDLYLRNLDGVNNWDLVDSSAHQVLGEWLVDRDRLMLDALAASPILWRRRVAVVSTLAFIRRGEVDWTFRLVKQLLEDRHDLMHKACGWMLREAYKKRAGCVFGFLEEHGDRMPRTMLRYAIERVPVPDRKRLLQKYRSRERG